MAFEHAAPAPAYNVTGLVRTKQIRVGVLLFAVCLAAAVAFRAGAVGSPFRYVLFLPILVAFNALAMGLTGVCGISATRAVRQTEEGEEPIADRDEVKALRRRGIFVLAGAWASAVAATVTLID